MRTMSEASRQDSSSTFASIFCRPDHSFAVRVPDYQRAFAWEQKQIDLFIQDIRMYQNRIGEYYFGHFIAEDVDKCWDIVDGQQRLTTFVLFLMVCRFLSPDGSHESSYSLIPRFSTVSYDNDALVHIYNTFGDFLTGCANLKESKDLSDDQIIKGLALNEATYTRSQRRMVLALHRFYMAFHTKDKLCRDRIECYIKVIMSAHCSLYLTRDKSVAVSIFEMQNTRGIPLTTLEIVKAKLMKFVYDHGRDNKDKDDKVEAIRESFGQIYRMEEQLASCNFRGDMSMEHLLRLHLRAVDDGNKTKASQFSYPAANASSDAIIDYVDAMLNYENGDRKKAEKPRDAGLKYAINVAREFYTSVRIASESLPAWDNDDALVGDVLILERDLTCQFFLIACRQLESQKGKADGRVDGKTLGLWERLLFTRDFHGKYYNLKGSRDNFPELFESCKATGAQIRDVIQRYVVDGFRPDKTRGLQSIVIKHLEDNKQQILTNAFHWWKSKMIYAIYKFEISKGTKLREVMKGTISVEHILPQEWNWDWVNNAIMKERKEESIRQINSCINGIGNLLLITPGENSTVGNHHPAQKIYDDVYDGGSYKAHNENREEWKAAENWCNLIHGRGNAIYTFMIEYLINGSENSPNILVDTPNA